MKAKKVHEYLNEKFTDEFDPISDMNIGKVTDIYDFITNDIKNLLHDLGFKSSTTFKARFHFDKSYKSGHLNICIDLVDERGLMFKKDIVDNKFKFKVSFIPFKKFLMIFKELKYEKGESVLFDEIILRYNLNDIRIIDKKILQKIESIINNIESKII